MPGPSPPPSPLPTSLRIAEDDSQEPTTMKLNASTALVIAIPLVALYILRRVREYKRARADIGGLRGITQLLGPGSAFGIALARLRERPWDAIARGFRPFAESGWDAVAIVSLFPTLKLTVDIVDPAAAKEVMNDRARFPKPLEFYRHVRFFGPNIVATEGAQWKRHRRVVAPAFAEKNYRLVWDEAGRIVQELLDHAWGRAEVVELKNGIDVTVPITLYVIASAGFGKRISWADESGPPAGHSMTFKQAIHAVSSNVFAKVLYPRWVMGATKHLRHLRDAFDDFEKYIYEMIDERRVGEKRPERADLFSNLLQATEADGDADSRLSDQELAANVFIFLLAGHETTAHTLCFCLAYLALYPHEQDRLYEEVKSVLPGLDTPPAYEDMARLPYALACFYETLRILPAAPGVGKITTQDEAITISSTDGAERRTVPLPKGTYVAINMAAMHRHPRYWNEPDEFKPERFLGDWPRDAFTPFSAGPRSCIGRRFSETEAVVILSMLVLHYRVSIAGEKPERVLRSKPGMTTTPVRVPLTFTRRY
ncbi:cytochrome P450 [Vararia minispora EC-137]|uniref:Cytochrome P450 n=1 Tax=Vararia minispora EC-137 TaxID=1314806 RepID=A0ACB8Q6C8_9AGAM|nr:cytochrome P450 [Vararia minispora EC-137]